MVVNVWFDVTEYEDFVMKYLIIEAPTSLKQGSPI